MKSYHFLHLSQYIVQQQIKTKDFFIQRGSRLTLYDIQERISFRNKRGLASETGEDHILCLLVHLNLSPAKFDLECRTSAKSLSFFHLLQDCKLIQVITCQITVALCFDVAVESSFSLRSILLIHHLPYQKKKEKMQIYYGFENSAFKVLLPASRSGLFK